MSLYNGDTGNVPPPPSGNNDFENVNIGSNSENMNVAENAQAEYGPVEPPVEDGETLATEESVNIATAEPETPVASVSKSGKPMSAAQSNLQRLRSETLEDMRKRYSDRFSDSSIYPKPPKAKAYHAAGLTTIRQRDGEEAYETALKDIMDKNDPAMGTNGMSRLSLSRKSKKPARNSTLRNNSSVSSAPQSITHIEEMARTAKGLIDSIVQASKAGSNSTNAKSLKPKRVRSKTTKKKPLFTIPEDNSAAQ